MGHFKQRLCQVLANGASRRKQTDFLGHIEHAMSARAKQGLAQLATSRNVSSEISFFAIFR
jgi:hypothetical protein